MWLVSAINRQCPDTWHLVGFWEHAEEDRPRTVNGVPVIGPHQLAAYLPGLHAIAGIGDPKARARAAGEASDIGCQFVTLVHPSVMLDPETVAVGPGSIICAGSILTVNIVIGSHVIINLDCTIGHDSVLEDYVTVSPGCHLSGYTVVRSGAYLGTGAVTVERHEIGAHAYRGCGGCCGKRHTGGCDRDWDSSTAKDSVMIVGCCGTVTDTRQSPL